MTAEGKFIFVPEPSYNHSLFTVFLLDDLKIQLSHSSISLSNTRASRHRWIECKFYQVAEV